MIERAAALPPGADGLFFSPHLGGRICPATPQMRGSWIGASWSHSQAHFFRAILESIAYEYAYYLGILRELIPDLSLVEARAVGGGARSNAWNQIKSNVLGVPYQRLAGNEFGTWGAAMIAGKAAGIIENLAEHARKTALPPGDPIQPDPASFQVYQPLVKRYIRMQEMLEQFYQS